MTVEYSGSEGSDSKASALYSDEISIDTSGSFAEVNIHDLSNHLSCVMSLTSYK